jgi:hypothetical protein
VIDGAVVSQLASEIMKIVALFDNPKFKALK